MGGFGIWSWRRRRLQPPQYVFFKLFFNTLLNDFLLDLHVRTNEWPRTCLRGKRMWEVFCQLVRRRVYRRWLRNDSYDLCQDFRLPYFCCIFLKGQTRGQRGLRGLRNGNERLPKNKNADTATQQVSSVSIMLLLSSSRSFFLVFKSSSSSLTLCPAQIYLGIFYRSLSGYLILIGLLYDLDCRILV